MPAPPGMPCPPFISLGMAAPVLGTGQALDGRNGDGGGDGEHPQGPSLEGKKEGLERGVWGGGEAKYLPATLARCPPPPAVLWLFLRKDGDAGAEHRRRG